jgi:hypothetical protein
VIEDGVNGQGTYSMETTHRPRCLAKEEEAGLTLCVADKNKTQTYLHYCRFWDVNVRYKLIVVFHEYFKRFHIAEKHKIMAAAKEGFYNQKDIKHTQDKTF